MARFTGPVRHSDSSSEVIRLAMMDVNYPPSLRNREQLLAGRGINICREMVRHG